MRQELKSLAGKNFSCTGSFIKYNDKGYVLLKNIITVHDKYLTDHVWLDLKRHKGNPFKAGDLIAFSGRIGRYTKSFIGRRVSDYGFRKVINIYKKDIK